MKIKYILLIDLFTGLYTSFKYFFRKKFTVSYPEKRLIFSDRFRGLFKVELSTCIGCMICANNCPIQIIHIETRDEISADGKKKKVASRFDIDIKRCMFCGMCEAACPSKGSPITLRTKVCELATYERNNELYFNKEKLLKYTDEFKLKNEKKYA